MVFKNLYPLISCICITANRPSFLLKAIIYFDSQNYPNKELIISYPKNDSLSKQLVENVTSITDINILAIERENDISVGSARNQAVEECNGEYVCTWDDDDWYREIRLMFQFTVLRSVVQKREACILTNILLYDILKDCAYFSGTYNWAGSLLCKKEIILLHPYLDRNIAEDADLIKYLISSKYLHYYSNYDLYAFVYHGNNVLDYFQFSYFTRNKELLNQENKDWISDIINRNVSIIPS